MIKKCSLVFITLFVLVCLYSSVEAKKTARLPVTCLPRMFTIESGGLEVQAQTVRVRYKIQLNGTYDLESNTLVDYFITCLRFVLFRSTSRTTNRVTETTYALRNSDNITDFLYQDIEDLDALSTYDIQIGYQLKDPLPEKVYVVTQTTQTCFGVPPRPTNVTLSVYLNASYLLQWNEPPVVFNSPPICYYIVTLRYQNSGSELEEEVPDRYFYLSKERSRQTVNVRVFSVNDVRCLTFSFPFVNNCVNKTVRSSPGTSYRIDPAVDYVGKSSFVDVSTILTIFFAILPTLLNQIV